MWLGDSLEAMESRELNEEGRLGISFVSSEPKMISPGCAPVTLMKY
jgi:hypothetical protein